MACNCEGNKYNIRMGCCVPVLAPIENYYTKYQVDELIEDIKESGCCITDEEVDEKIASAKTEIEAEIPTVPTNVSAFVNDVPYLTEHQSLSGYVTDADLTAYTYDKATIDSKVASGGTFDPTNYYTKSQVDNLLSNYVTFDDMAEYVGDIYTKTESDNLFVSKDLFITTIYNLNQEINSLKEAISGCCGSTGETEYRWIVVPNDYTCSGTTKMTKEKQQSSTDGINWTDTGQYRTGSTVLEYDSVDCGYAPSSNFKVRANYKRGYTVGSGQVECNTSTTVSRDEVKNQITFPSYFTSVEFGSCIDTIGENAFINGLDITSVTIPSNIETIGEGAFKDVGNSVTSFTVTLNEGLITIGDFAFAGCDNLTEIQIPNSVTTIGDGAFEACEGLTRVVIGSGVTFIGNGAFQKSSGYTPYESITCLATVPPTLEASNVFHDNHSCPIYVPSASVNAYKTANNWSTYADRIQAIP